MGTEIRTISPLRRIGKGWDIFDFSETAERNSSNLDGEQVLNTIYQVCVFQFDRKTTTAALVSIGWHFLDFSETTERNSTNLDRKQDLNVLYQIIVCCADRKIKMADLAFDWLRYFRLLLCKGWMEFNQSNQRMCFSGRSLSACDSFQNGLLRCTTVALWASCFFFLLNYLFKVENTQTLGKHILWHFTHKRSKCSFYFSGLHPPINIVTILCVDNIINVAELHFWGFIPRQIFVSNQYLEISGFIARSYGGSMETSRKEDGRTVR